MLHGATKSQQCKGHTLSTCYTQLLHPSCFCFLLHIFQLRKDPISLYIIHQPLLSLISSLFPLSLSSGVPSGCPEHMCFGLPRAEPYLSPAWEQTAGFVCGSINQLSFNKNRKPDERQREETWGVGPYLGRKKKKGSKGKKEGRGKREK